MRDPNAVTTIGLVLAEWIDQIVGEYPDMSIVYDEQLTLETALTKIRAKRERDQQNGVTIPASEFPLFAFKRSPLKFPTHGMGRRSQVTRLYNPEVDELNKQQGNPIFYKTIYGILEVPFMYYVETLQEEEVFELEYLAEDHLSFVKNLTVDIPDIGAFNYYASYTPIEDKIVKSNDLYYKVVQGTVSFLGWYIVLEGRGKIITEIQAKIKNFQNEILSEIEILAE